MKMLYFSVRFFHIIHPWVFLFSSFFFHFFFFLLFLSVVANFSIRFNGYIRTYRYMYLYRVLKIFSWMYRKHRSHTYFIHFYKNVNTFPFLVPGTYHSIEDYPFIYLRRFFFFFSQKKEAFFFGYYIHLYQIWFSIDACSDLMHSKHKQWSNK